MLRIFKRKIDTGNDPFCGVTLGDQVKDTLTGFTGIVIGRVEYLTGCNQLCVLPKSDKDNELKDVHWFDIERIEKLADRAVEISSRYTGADIPSPPSTAHRIQRGI
ncbi:hypothetical protein [Thioclava sp. GXIMD2076]|uniref:hypothetical protein n=1 Tax=Thioclava sp. GXIMD2076 TaxID=3131931 RepID=UPI0030D46206